MRRNLKPTYTHSIHIFKAFHIWVVTVQRATDNKIHVMYSLLDIELFFRIVEAAERRRHAQTHRFIVAFSMQTHGFRW